MDARAEIRAEPGKIPGGATEQASEKRRGAPFGILVAVILASLLWAALIGVCVYLVT